MPKRCALGCLPSGLSTHVFPHPERFPETFRTWVAVVGGKLKSPQDVEYYRKKIICDIHFAEKDKNRNNRLNCLAVPTLFLPSKSIQQNEMNVEQPVDQSTASQNLFLDETIQPIEMNVQTPLDQPTTSQNLLVDARIWLEHNYVKYNNTSNLSNMQAFRSHQPASVLKESRSYKKIIKNLKTQLRRSRQQARDFKSRLSNAEKMSNEASFQRIAKKMSAEAKIFTRMQFIQTHKAPSGRRFKIEEKILSLSLFKKSPKCYNLLAKYFTLSSAKTLKTLLAAIKIRSGCNDIVFDKLKETVSKMNIEDRLCTVIFDEMALTPQIHYDINRDELKGFSDFTKNKIANHVLVFMIKGIKANYKQPVAYYFTDNLSKIHLKKVIIEVISKLQSTGLIVLCTICDQGTANVSAINELVSDTKKNYYKKGKDWRHDIYEINKKQIVPLFDVPHLLKGLRNNLLNKDLKHLDDSENVEKTIKWKYFEEVYMADKCLGELRLLHKLTEEHINIEKIRKMRVKPAAQLFSHSVAVVTEHLSARGLVSQECRQLIPFVTLVDKLFDSLNASTFNIPNGKVFKACIKRNSPHHHLWQRAIKVLKTIKFVQYKKCNASDKISVIESTVPTIKNFIRTIEGMQLLWKILSTKYSFDSMLSRNFNQDPLENFFGNIRSYGVRNVDPNYICFEGAFKALLLNNFNSPHSVSANCEQDDNSCLENLKFFVDKKPQICSYVPEENVIININQDILCEKNDHDLGQKSYVCGWVLTKCLKKVIRGCKICKEKLIANRGGQNNDYILAKEYSGGQKQWLTYPSEECKNLFHEIQHITVAVLKKDVPKIYLKRNIILISETLIQFPCICSLHYEDFKKQFLDTTINVIICSWCRFINRILSGKVTYDGDDEIKNIAKEYYNKYKHNKTKRK